VPPSFSGKALARVCGFALAGALCLYAAASAGATKGSARAVRPARTLLTCAQANQGWLFNSYNQCGALNGAKPVVVKLTKPAHITQIADYHFNRGVAVKPGTIGLQAANGYVFGPYRATQAAGTWDWIASMSITVPAGSYTVVDSSPSTWSQNSASHGVGFTRVFGSFVASAPPVPAPKKTTTPTGTSSGPTCASSPPSTFEISPAHASGGATVSLLLSCQKPAPLGFRGAFKPLKVEIYDEASYRNLHYVNGRLQPISASFPVRPPLVPSFTVVGDQDVEITLPGSIQPTTYVVVIVDSVGDVASAGLLTVP
jgi:hypothetical protein